MSEREKSLWYLFFSALSGLGALITALPSVPALWETPEGVGGLLLIIASVGLGWIGKGQSGYNMPGK